MNLDDEMMYGSMAELTNQVARRYAQKRSDDDEDGNDCNGQVHPGDFSLLAEDELQKIRRSNHSNHRVRHMEIMDHDPDHDDLMKGMFYSGRGGLDDDDSDEFFDDSFVNEEHQTALSNRHPMGLQGPSSEELSFSRPPLSPRSRRITTSSHAATQRTHHHHDHQTSTHTGRPFGDDTSLGSSLQNHHQSAFDSYNSFNFNPSLYPRFGDLGSSKIR